MGKWPQAAPDKEEIVTMEFKEGEQARAVAPSMLCVPNGQRGLRRCVAMNGKAMTPLEVIQEANKIGGRNGLGARWLAARWPPAA
eukprot:scaffold98987_cov29-Tisochrysis_lutea.AAC.5